jgi:6,7-dimethyl-8-ribityllumazine synthase
MTSSAEMTADVRVALCVATFYEQLAASLEEGARDALSDAGVGDVDRYEVPGAFELPLIAKYAAESGKYGAIICLGAVIRGDTDHYKYVSGEAARGIQDVQLSYGIPCGFGVLTVDTVDQARARVKGGAKRDSGRHAVEAALAALAVKEQVSGRRRPTGFAA